MNVAEFDYYLPEDRIAQTSVSPRDQARMLVMNRVSGDLKDARVFDLPSFLHTGDLLIFNDTKVFKARLHGTVHGKNVEVFLLHAQPFESPDEAERRSGVSKVPDIRLGRIPGIRGGIERGRHGSCWTSLLKPGRRVSVGDEIVFADGVVATCVSKDEDGTASLAFNRTQQALLEWTDAYGAIPSPPYVKQLEDENAYQTVYAKHTGSVAAPTAGFHFTDELLAKIDAMGVKRAFVTLHVGLGTFRPMKTETLEDHMMHEEWGQVPKTTTEAIAQTKACGGRVIVVGTTAMRAIESMARKGLHEWSGWTDLFITPGYEFKIADGLITNFHLPKSTLLVLVSAFARREHILRAYEHAIKNEYRFYSFGDAMMII